MCIKTRINNFDKGEQNLFAFRIEFDVKQKRERESERESDINKSEIVVCVHLVWQTR